MPPEQTFPSVTSVRSNHALELHSDPALNRVPDQKLHTRSKNGRSQPASVAFDRIPSRWMMVFFCFSTNPKGREVIRAVQNLAVKYATPLGIRSHGHTHTRSKIELVGIFTSCAGAQLAQHNRALTISVMKGE